MFFAGAKTLQDLLPQVGLAHNVSVILRLRGRTTLGSTFLSVVSDYADRLQRNGGRLYLTGLDPAVLKVWESEALSKRLTGVLLYPATEVVGAGYPQCVAGCEHPTRSPRLARVGTHPTPGRQLRPGRTRPSEPLRTGNSS